MNPIKIIRKSCMCITCGSFLSILFLIGFILLFNVIYQPDKYYSDQYKSTSCIVINHIVKPLLCDDLSPFECYSGYLNVTFTIYDVTYYSEMVAYSGLKSEDEVIRKLDREYPIGKRFVCYSNINNHSKVISDNKEYNAMVGLGLSIFFLVISFIILVVFSTFSLIYFVKFLINKTPIV